MTGLNELLERAVGDQPALSVTRETAVAAGRRAARRRRTLAVGTCAGVLAVAGVATVALGAGGGGGGGRAPAGGPNTMGLPVYPVPALPAAAGVPGALQRPDLVGSDPLLSHFTVDTSAWPLSEATYMSSDGSETVSAGGLTITVSRTRDAASLAANPELTQLSASPGSVVPNGDPGTTGDPGLIGSPGTTDQPGKTEKPTTVGGRPATLTTRTETGGKYRHYGLLWQPVDGLWVGMSVESATAEAELWSDVDALHLDRTGRCVVPFRLTDLPAGAKVLGCVAGVPVPGQADVKFAFSSLLVGDGRGDQASVSIGEITRPDTGGDVGPNYSPAPLPPPNRTVNGHPIFWSSSRPMGFISDDFDGVPLSIDVRGSYREPQATQILAGLKLSANLIDPKTWPSDPIGR
ncbi:hypothetical protein [Rugosimonospora africana]|uniref:Uncharacterized protein n=1 Tax=Rugosimonospora africana TaxID=556532 RepID=A0A8J3QRN2_9ACTN|nr:hypothetical protein [Rugosimonospora africana]GIH14405.1 hypothetical protein Raf01_25770 [Rugosimonospora africana]